MKKSSKIGISKNEYELIEEIRENELAIFTANDLSKLLGWTRIKSYKTLDSLKRKGIVLSAVNGKYVLSSIFQEHDVLSVASQIVWPSYISFWTALNFYKFTEQLPRTVFVATTKAKKEVTFEEQKIKFVSISKRRFFGYLEINDAVIADKEKAILDSLLLPRYAGGINEILKCLKNAWNELDKEKLTAYALKMQNKSLVKRLGFLIESNDLKIEKKLIERLHKNIGRDGFSKLEPQLPKKNEYNKKWGVIINVEM